MGRSKQPGFRYFPLDTSFPRDNKVRRAMRKKDNSAMLYITLLCTIYDSEEGYYYPWDEDSAFLLGETAMMSEEDVTKAVVTLLDCDLLHKGMFAEKHILTSAGIQRQYVSTCKQNHRVYVINPEHCLIEIGLADISVPEQHSSEFFANNQETIANNDEYFAPKLKESKLYYTRLYYSCNTRALAREQEYSEEEQEEILFFDAFFKNWLSPAKELTKIKQYNNLPGKTPWSQLTLSQKCSILSLWRPKDENNRFTSAQRFKEPFLNAWKQLFLKILNDDELPYSICQAMTSDAIEYVEAKPKNIVGMSEALENEILNGEHSEKLKALFKNTLEPVISSFTISHRKK